MEIGWRILALSVGGVLGVNARYWLGFWISRWSSPQFPWATLVINVSGSFAIGFLTVLLMRWLPHPNVRLLVLTGFLGGFTTFSTFAFESATLWERGESGRALAYVVGSAGAALMAVGLGMGLARAWTIPTEERSMRSSPAQASARPTEAVEPRVDPAEGGLAP